MALAAAGGIYVGHLMLKHRSALPVSGGLRRICSQSWFQKLIRYLSFVLAVISLIAFAHYFTRWNARGAEPWLNALLIAPLAYYGFACGKLVLRKSVS